MGCNTSKESVQPVEGEEKAEEQTKQEVNGDTNNKEHCSKPSSADSTETAKATTPTTNSAKSEARLSNHIDQEENSDIKEAATTSPSQEEIKESNSSTGGKPTADTGAQSATTVQEQEEEEAAATKIQAVFRGHQTRQTMKQADNKQTAEPEPTRQQLEAEFRADDAELCKAATTIQNSFRNHLKTKQGDGKDGEPGASGKKENKEEQEEELDIDLTDPDLNKAATKIQASFRGHKVRKENEGTGGDQ
ncbi:igloo [Carabus blaptoides fortunei]